MGPAGRQGTPRPAPPRAPALPPRSAHLRFLQSQLGISLFQLHLLSGFLQFVDGFAVFSDLFCEVCYLLCKEVVKVACARLCTGFGAAGISETLLRRLWPF